MNNSDSFEILVVGEFSGRDTETNAIHDRSPVPIDIDTFERRLAQILPTCQLTEGLARLQLEFAELEDFHPESLMATSAVSDWIDQRLASRRASAESGDTALPPETPPDPDDQQQSLFSNLIGDTKGSLSPEKSPSDSVRDAVEELARRVVQPAAPTESSGASSFRAAALGEIIAAPPFRRLERNWRGLHRFLRATPDQPNLRVSFVDIGLADLVAGFKAGGATQRAALPEFLGAGRNSWSLILLADELKPVAEELGLLASIGILGSLAGAPVIAGCDPSLVGLSTWNELSSREPSQPEGEAGEIWQSIRTSPIAPWIGLVGPRLLARVPYGKHGETTDPPVEESDSLLWSPASLACGELIAHSFANRGWDMTANDSLALDDLPMALSETRERLSPCETWISDRSADALNRHGVMALVADRSRDCARLSGFRSVGESETRLSGRWQNS